LDFEHTFGSIRIGAEIVQGVFMQAKSVRESVEVQHIRISNRCHLALLFSAQLLHQLQLFSGQEHFEPLTCFIECFQIDYLLRILSSSHRELPEDVFPLVGQLVSYNLLIILFFGRHASAAGEVQVARFNPLIFEI